MPEGAITLHHLSDLSVSEAQEILGAKILKVKGGEYFLELILDNGKTLKVSGHAYTDSALGVEIG